MLHRASFSNLTKRARVRLRQRVCPAARQLGEPAAGQLTYVVQRRAGAGLPRCASLVAPDANFCNQIAGRKIARAADGKGYGRCAASFSAADLGAMGKYSFA